MANPFKDAAPPHAIAEFRPDTPPAGRFAFGPYLLDVHERRLLRAGEIVRLAPKAFDLLAVLVDGGGRLLTKEELMRRVWPDTVVEEGNLPFTISVLRKALQEGTNSDFIETVPKQGYRLSVPVEGALPSAEGRAAGIRPSPPPRNWRVAASVGVVSLLVGLAAGSVFWRRWPEPIRAIAVMPLEAVDPHTDGDYLGPGIANALIARLAGLPDLRVVAGGSKPSGGSLRADQQARRLGVDALLSGTFHREKGRIRINVQLVRADGASIWSGRFDDEWSEIAATQDRIAEGLAVGLLRELPVVWRDRARRRAAASAEAYELYLKGRHLWSRRTPETIRSAIQAYGQALDRDPGFALGWAGLADAYAISASGLPGAERFPKAREAALRALQLDPELAEGHTAMAFLTYKSQWDWPGAEASFKKAIALDARYALARHWYGEFLSLVGRDDEAVAQLRRAIDLEPTATAIWFDLSGALSRAERFAEAAEASRKALELDPSEWRAHSTLGTALIGLGQHDAGVDAVLRANLMLGARLDEVNALRKAFASGGYAGYVRKRIEQGLAEIDEGRARPFGMASRLATDYAILGEVDAALRWLERALERREDAPLHVLRGFNRPELKRDPRFVAIAKRVGLGNLARPAE